MKFSSLIIASIVALASAQKPKGGAGGKGGGFPKGGGAPGMGGAGGKGGKGGFGGFGGLMAGACAMSCTSGMMGIMTGDCNIQLPSKGGAAPPAGGAVFATTTTQPAVLDKRQGPPAGGMPKIDPAVMSSAKNCMCKNAKMASIVNECIPSACATATGTPAAMIANLMNGMCKGVEGFKDFSAAAAAPAKTPAP